MDGSLGLGKEFDDLLNNANSIIGAECGKCRKPRSEVGELKTWPPGTPAGNPKFCSSCRLLMASIGK